MKWNQNQIKNSKIIRLSSCGHRISGFNLWLLRCSERLKTCVCCTHICILIVYIWTKGLNSVHMLWINAIILMNKSHRFDSTNLKINRIQLLSFRRSDNNHSTENHVKWPWINAIADYINYNDDEDRIITEYLYITIYNIRMYRRVVESVRPFKLNVCIRSSIQRAHIKYDPKYICLVLAWPLAIHIWGCECLSVCVCVCWMCVCIRLRIYRKKGLSGERGRESNARTCQALSEYHESHTI